MADTSNPQKTKKFSRGMLIAMVVGSMVGAGVFSLPHRFAEAGGVFGTLLAWLIAGTGMLMLALVFQNLANRKPKIDAGVFAYAKAGFGDYLGFFSAFGYWASACVGNVFYWILIQSTLSALFPALGEGNTLLAVAISSVMIWVFHVVVARGVREAASINRIVTIAKIIPLVLFVIIAAFAFKADVFSANFIGSDTVSPGEIYEQVKATMLLTVFVFIGVEGASIYSRYAKKREDVGKATVIGFLLVLALFTAVTLLSFGVLPRAELAGLSDPSVGGVLEAIVGRWGAVFVGAGLIISVLGAYLAWTLMSAEVLYQAAKNDDMPKFLAKQNAKKVPANALLLTTLMIQAILIATLFSDDALTLALTLCATLSLLPYLLSGAYALKLTITRETYDKDASSLRKDMIIAGIATLYGAFLIYATGPELLLLSSVIYLPGTALYFIARRERGLRLFNAWEKVLFAVTTVAAIFGIIFLASGGMRDAVDDSVLENSTDIEYIQQIQEGKYMKTEEINYGN